MVLPGFTAEYSLYRTSQSYTADGTTSARATGADMVVQPAQIPSECVHCYWDSVWCANRTLWVRCLCSVRGMLSPQNFPIGSC